MFSSSSFSCFLLYNLIISYSPLTSHLPLFSQTLSVLPPSHFLSFAFILLFFLFPCYLIIYSSPPLADFLLLSSFSFPLLSPCLLSPSSLNHAFVFLISFPPLFSFLLLISSSLHFPPSHTSPPLSTSLSFHRLLLPLTSPLCLRLIKISKIQMAAG